MTHRFQLNGLNIVHDTGSGAFHVVSDQVYEVIPDIEALHDQGLLFSTDDFADVAERVVNRASIVKALCLNVAHACNLSCAYCFAGEGRYAGEAALMSLETGKRALDFLVSHSGGRRNLEVDFFGGEPLLNYEVVKGIVAYGRDLEKKHEKNFRFTLTTNGLLLTAEMFHFLNAEMGTVVLSLDGRKEVNDRFRKKKDGSGCYDDIVSVFQELVASRNNNGCYVRGTFTRKNLDFASDVLHLRELGFKNVSLEPAICFTDDELGLAIREEDLESVFAEYERLASEIIKIRDSGEELDFFHFGLDLDGGPCTLKRLTGCSAGYEYLALSPSGDIYPCHQFVGDDRFRLGNLADGLMNEDLRGDFRKICVLNKPACRECFAMFHCSGGCVANAYKTTGDILGIDKVYCALQRKRVECAMMLEAVRKLKNDKN